MPAATQTPVAVVLTNDPNLVAAIVAVHALQTRGGSDGSFNVELHRLEDSELAGRDGQTYRDGHVRTWDSKDRNAFQILRHAVPDRMGYAGRALVMDPDVFAVRPIAPLLERGLGGKSILARHIPEGFLGDGVPYTSLGVALLDCEKLKHWRWREDIESLFNHTRDLSQLRQIGDEDPGQIGELGEEWNSLDKLGPETGLLHMTRISTQPWLTGLPVAEEVYEPGLERSGATPRHRPHPDPAQARLFFELLAECLHQSRIPERFLEAQIANRTLRADAFEALARVGYRRGTTFLQRQPTMFEEFGIDEEVLVRSSATPSLGAASPWFRRLGAAPKPTKSG